MFPPNLQRDAALVADRPSPAAAIVASIKNETERETAQMTIPTYSYKSLHNCTLHATKMAHAAQQSASPISLDQAKEVITQTTSYAPQEELSEASSPQGLSSSFALQSEATVLKEPPIQRKRESKVTLEKRGRQKKRRIILKRKTVQPPKKRIILRTVADTCGRHRSDFSRS